jgi:hypothetical protein
MVHQHLCDKRVASWNALDEIEAFVAAAEAEIDRIEGGLTGTRRRGCKPQHDRKPRAHDDVARRLVVASIVSICA